MMAVTTNRAPRASILVAGDVVTDHCLYEGQRRRPGSPMRLGTTAAATRGGAALLADLLDSVANRLNPALSVTRGFVNAAAASTANGYCVFRPFPGATENDKVWRVAEALGFDEGAAQQAIGSQDDSVLGAPHQVVVLDDGGGAFRRWPSSFAWPRFLLDPACEPPDWLVIKVSYPFAAGDLWHTLLSGETQDETPVPVRDSSELRARTIAVLSIHDLRVESVAIARGLSWERTAFDLIEELCGNPDLAGLRELGYVVVSLESDAALLAEFSGSRPVRFCLVFDPAAHEGTYRDSVKGSLYGFQTCLAAAVAARLAGYAQRVGTGNLCDSASTRREVIEQGVVAGLCGMRRLLGEGHGTIGTPPTFPFASVAEEIVSQLPSWSFGVADVPAGRPRSDAWTVIAGDSGVGASEPLFGLARRVALYGVKELKQTPFLQFGDLLSVERTEIESLRTLERLLRSYEGDEKAKKPLSIAAFGPPGAGKSFGVKELSRAIFGRDVPLLEFNLSQFKDASELHGLFHQVRDCGLRGRMPVIFWDEFDSRDLDWLQYLLAPMQDGAFQAGQITHPVGKCVFVFAGGTCHRFEDFGQPPEELLGDAAEEADWKRQFQAKKGPDFKSRLAGYLNVTGPNPRDGADVTYPVRRALLLRVHLGAAPTDRLHLDRGLLTAFLAIAEYRHGSRSLEKIAEQVRLSRGARVEFTRSDLPPRSQLDLHVKADDFLNLLERV